MKYVAAVLLFGVAGMAEEAKKPACNAATHGRLWPEEANVSRDAARQFYQRGELELCTQAVWKYKWQRLSVNARSMQKTKAR
jgi:hypothetical protein